MNSTQSIFTIKSISLFAIFILFCLFESSYSIRCYKCKGDDECDFKTRQIYIDNCTWATKCWGARIGNHFIRSCADDRCEIQLGVGSYIESKCCYTDLCNNDDFFFPNGSNRSTNINITTICIVFVIIMLIKCLIFKRSS